MTHKRYGPQRGRRELTDDSETWSDTEPRNQKSGNSEFPSTTKYGRNKVSN